MVCLCPGAVAAVAAAVACLSAGVVAWPYAQVSGWNEGDACSAPDDGRPGVCTSIYDCPPLLALLDGSPSQSDIMTLNHARCSFKDSVPIVCCPGSGSTRPPATRPPGFPSPTPAPTPRPPPPNPVTDGWDAGDRPLPVEGHRNLPLLPLDRCSPGAIEKVFGGKEADLYAYPWMARLGYRSRANPRSPVQYLCGGSLINDRYVLTAAHCFTDKRYALVSVQLGEHNVEKPIDCRVNSTTSCLPPPLVRDVEEVVSHPLYQKSVFRHDIALLRLSPRVDIVNEEFVRPVCLPMSADNQNLPLDTKKMIVAGWGLTEAGEASKVLLDVVVPAVPLDKCQEEYRKVVRDATLFPEQLCAGGQVGQDSCKGDSGGPLMYFGLVEGEVKTVQFGVVSFGPRNCGTAGVPGVYTRVAHYAKWILDNLRP